MLGSSPKGRGLCISRRFLEKSRNPGRERAVAFESSLKGEE
jgi:hypothetical protein